MDRDALERARGRARAPGPWGRVVSIEHNTEIITIEGPDWALDIAPGIGAGLVAARAKVGSTWTTVTRPVDPEALAEREVRRLGGFVMAPFCNRIDQGRFPFEGRVVRAPLNWAADPTVAIHGLSWRRPWRVMERSRTSLTLGQSVAIPECDLAYDATLVFQAHGLAVGECLMTLAIENRSPRRLPFGLGFHPYLRRAPGAMLAFTADGQMMNDARGLPVSWRRLAPAEQAARGFPVDVLSGIDTGFTGWTRNAELTFPDAGAALTIKASDGARLLHVYVPRDAGYLCLEPVSHVTDVGNRREFAVHGDLDTLGPREQTQMTMSWRIAALRSRN